MNMDIKYKALYFFLSIATVFAGYASILLVSVFISMIMMHYLIKISKQLEDNK